MSAPAQSNTFTGNHSLSACRIRTRLWLCFTIACTLVVFSPQRANAAPDNSDSRLPEPAEASSVPAYRALYLTLGLGGTAIGVAGRVQITGAYRHWFAAGLLAKTMEFQLFGPTPAESLWEAGALTGYHQDFGSFILSTGIGIAWTSTVTRGALRESASASGHLADEFAEVLHEGLGLPFAVQAIYHGGTFGIGAQVFGNYNAKLPLLGLVGTLHVGNF